MKRWALVGCPCGIAGKRLDSEVKIGSELCRGERLPRPSPRVFVWHLVASPPVLVFLVLLAGCGHKSETRPDNAQELPAIAVRIQAVETKRSPAIEEVVGTVRAKLRATLEGQASGRIAAMPVVLGQQVTAGERVARLDAPEVKARLEQAEASLQQAEQEWKRVSALFSQQAATRADYDAANARYLVAKGAAAEARALMGYVEVLAPFDGVVTRKRADLGDLAAPGKPLVDLEDPTRLQLEADVPEAIAARVQPGARMTIRLSQIAPEISGTVAEIAPIADPTSRTFRVKLDLLSTPGLMSGQFARLIVPLGDTTCLRVPSSAVVQRGQMEIVFTAHNQRAQLHLVKTGRRIADETEILSGLDSGDAVVAENASQLVDGQRLQVK